MAPQEEAPPSTERDMRVSRRSVINLVLWVSVSSFATGYEFQAKNGLMYVPLFLVSLIWVVATFLRVHRSGR